MAFERFDTGKLTQQTIIVNNLKTALTRAESLIQSRPESNAYDYHIKQRDELTVKLNKEQLRLDEIEAAIAQRGV